MENRGFKDIDVGMKILNNFDEVKKRMDEIAKTLERWFEWCKRYGSTFPLAKIKEIDKNQETIKVKLAEIQKMLAWDRAPDFQTKQGLGDKMTY